MTTLSSWKISDYAMVQDMRLQKWDKRGKVLAWKIIKRTGRNAHAHTQNSLATQKKYIGALVKFVIFLQKFGKILDVSMKIRQKLQCISENSAKITMFLWKFGKNCSNTKNGKNLQKITKMPKSADSWKNLIIPALYLLYGNLK